MLLQFNLFKQNGYGYFKALMRKFSHFTLFVVMFLAFSCNSNDSNGPFFVEINEMTDPRDGQTYQIVKIGDQWWMAENLNYYTPSGSWYYNNDSLNYAETLGRLYSWETAMAGQQSISKNTGQVQGICPPGWHIPTDEEWEQLVNYLKKYELNGDDLKLNNPEFWQASTNATNKTHFNAIPSGTVYNGGDSFANIKVQTHFLTSTPDETTDGVWGFGLDANNPEIKKVSLDTKNGWSLRCVKD